MTISESLKSLNTFPIPARTIERIGVDRVLVITADYTKIIGESEAYKLATADTYFFLGTAPNIVEQEVGLNSAIAIKKELLKEANKIYALFGDAKFSGKTYGMIGDNFNA